MPRICILNLSSAFGADEAEGVDKDAVRPLLACFGGHEADDFEDGVRGGGQRLAEELGLPISSNVHINKTDENPERRTIEIDPSIRRKLTDLLADDVAFYERLRYRTPGGGRHPVRGMPLDSKKKEILCPNIL